MTISGYWRRGLRPWPSWARATGLDGKGRGGEVQEEKEEDLDAREDGGGVGGEADVNAVADAQDEAVGAEKPGPEKKRAFLSGPEGGELVGGVQVSVGMGQDVGDGEVVGEGGPGESEGGAGHHDEGADSGAARGFAEAAGGLVPGGERRASQG